MSRAVLHLPNSFLRWLLRTGDSWTKKINLRAPGKEIKGRPNDYLEAFASDPRESPMKSIFR